MEINQTWKQLYELAAELYRLSPWKVLYESDVFGVESPRTGKQYFISIMGSDGILPALAAYEGANALNQFWSIENLETGDASYIFTVPHLMLSFEDKKDIDPRQFERFQSSGNTSVFGEKFPELRHIIPGRFPDEPGEVMLGEMITILQQTLDVLRRSMDDPDLIFPEDLEEDTYLVRTFDTGNNAWVDKYLTVKSSPVDYKYTWTDEDISEINSLPLTYAVMQAHGQLLPLQVKEKDSLYFSYLIILINKKSEIIEKYELLIADPDFHSMLEKVPGRFLNFIKELGIRPRAIEVKNDTLFGMLSEPLRMCGIKLIKYKELPAVTKAINGILEYSDRQAQN